jgi:hypothetical protein
MPNGTLDGFNHILDFDEGLTDVFRVSAILFLRQSSRDVAAVRNLSISCCDQLLNVFVILSHSGGLLLINLFAQQLRQLGDIRRDPPRLVAGQELGRGAPTGLILEIDMRERLPVVIGRRQKVRRSAVAIQKSWRVTAYDCQCTDPLPEVRLDRVMQKSPGVVTPGLSC